MAVDASGEATIVWAMDNTVLAWSWSPTTGLGPATTVFGGEDEHLHRGPGLRLSVTPDGSATLAFAASVVYTADATTRYRAPFEALVVVFAVSTVVAVRQRPAGEL